MRSPQDPGGLFLRLSAIADASSSRAKFNAMIERAHFALRLFSAPIAYRVDRCSICRI
jgi:hypothetical protein